MTRGPKRRKPRRKRECAAKFKSCCGVLLRYQRVCSGCRPEWERLARERYAATVREKRTTRREKQLCVDCAAPVTRYSRCFHCRMAHTAARAGRDIFDRIRAAIARGRSVRLLARDAESLIDLRIDREYPDW